jgi:propionyl-CoA carboxylase alpha chain
LEHPDFVEGRADTGFLDRHAASELGRPLLGVEDERIAAVATSLADRSLAAESTSVLRTIPPGWRNSPSQTQRRTYVGEHGPHEIAYRTTRGGLDIDGFAGVPILVTPDVVELSFDGESTRFTISRYGSVRHIDTAIGPGRLVEAARFPIGDVEEAGGSIHAPMPGKVIRVTVEAGDNVEEGQVLMILEAMKMEHTIRAPHPGVVAEIRYQAGDQVESDVVLVVIEEEPRAL